MEIKKAYRSIVSIETTLQQAHQAEMDRARLNMADYTPPDLRDRSHSVSLISQHRQLAELHSSFLEMTCRPELPRDVQEYAEVRNLPSRLWQTAFHLMLESLRTSLSSNHHLQTNERRAEILDHLTEFIYYAYSFYSALLESERYKGFRRAWLESLGDLSRYRMAVAGLANSMAAEGRADETPSKQADSHQVASFEAARIDDDIDEDDSTSEDDNDADGDDEGFGSAQHRAQTRDEKGAPPRSKSLADPGREAPAAHENDKASIGTAALGDWDTTEKETWRQTAKGWYAMGIAETPSTGRLHHHLGVLSRGDDDLRAVYHLTKSLIAAKPFSPARDSILPLFNQEQQASRLHRESSVEELFLYLHGILITRVQLDDFEPVFDRLMAKLARLVEERGPAGIPQSVWTMMASINIASLFQYGAQDSLLASLLLEQAGKSDGRSNRTQKAAASTPTAILVSSTTPKTDDNLLSELPREAEWDDPSDDDSEVGGEAQVISLEAKSGSDEQEVPDELPIVLQKAATLCFSMHSLTFDLSSADASLRSNPYNTTVSTFLVSLCQSKKAFRMLERFIPWDLWLRRIDQSLSLFERTWPKCLSSSFITPQLLLPEDFCLRGILGLSRHLYDRNLWRNAMNDGGLTAEQAFDNEVEVLDADDAELYTRTESAWRAAASRRKDKAFASTSLDTVRDYRLAFVARKLAKAARGFDLDSKSSALSLSRLLLGRLSRQKLQEEQRQLEARIQELQLQSPAAVASSAHYSDDDDDFDSDWDSHSDHEAPASASAQAILSNADDADPSDEIRALHARSCFLRSLLCKRPNAAKSSTKPDRSNSKKGASPSVCEDLLPGYTTLVVDTNILVIPGDIIANLIDTKRWMVIVPLAVITELDGLRRNDSDVGREAERAIQFLESHIKSHAKCFKVQTSRGNYLTDLSCRSEDIDFTWQGGAEDGETRLDAGAGEKSVAARNVDEVILRLLAWQRDHFIDRRGLLMASKEASGSEKGSAKLALAHKSVLLTLDRNLRLKAKSRSLASMDDKGAASLLSLAALS
uniref:PIN domain-containing protein n=2 Tax=Kalmanozyma brasiliensis (strain GHG001) TaxID=1365824 RepID=V5EZX4_KALBG